MTLGEFRQFTELMTDDVKLAFSYCDGCYDINSFSVKDADTLVLVNKNYGEEDWHGIFKAMCMLSSIKKD